MLNKKAKSILKGSLLGLATALCITTVNPPVLATAEDMMTEIEPNDNPAEANELPLNTLLKGQTSGIKDMDWYEFIIPQMGMSRIEIKVADDNPNTSASWSALLEDGNRKELISISGRSVGSYYIGLAPGKYYIRVKGNSSKSNNTYNLMLNYTASEQWEQERYYKEKNAQNANVISLNRKYTGNLYCSYDVDYYRVNLRGKNKVSFKFSIDDTVANPGYWYIKLTEYSSKKVLGSYTCHANETITIPECSGELVAQISGYSSVGQMYHVEASATPIASPVAKPKATSITSVKAGKNQATISWKKASNATGYYVYRSTSAGSGYKKIATVSAKTTYKDTKSLKNGRTYYYKIVSVRKSGSNVLKSKASSYKSVTIR